MLLQCNALLDESLRPEFLEELEEDYEEIREDHYTSLKERRYLTLEQAQAKKFKIDWTDFKAQRPSFLGARHLTADISTLVEFIDWKPFFDVWQLRGKYPNRGYPKIFDDATVGGEARKVFDDALRLLEDVQRDKSLKATGAVAFYRAAAKGDDILCFDEAGVCLGTLFGLRQQVRRSCGGRDTGNYVTVGTRPVINYLKWSYWWRD